MAVLRDDRTRLYEEVALELHEKENGFAKELRAFEKPSKGEPSCRRGETVDSVTTGGGEGVSEADGASPLISRCGTLELDMRKREAFKLSRTASLDCGPVLEYVDGSTNVLTVNAQPGNTGGTVCCEYPSDAVRPSFRSGSASFVTLEPLPEEDNENDLDDGNKAIVTRAGAGAAIGEENGVDAADKEEVDDAETREMQELANELVGEWEVVPQLSESLETFLKAMGVVWWKRRYVGRLAMSISNKLQDPLHLHCTAFFPTGPRTLPLHLDGDPYDVSDPDCGYWRGICRAGSAPHAWGCGEGERCLQSIRTSKVGEVTECRRVFADKQYGYGRILRLQYRLVPKDVSKQPIVVNRICRPRLGSPQSGKRANTVYF